LNDHFATIWFQKTAVVDFLNDALVGYLVGWLVDSFSILINSVSLGA